MSNPIPPEWLPQAPVYVTVISDRPDGDALVEWVSVARDWKSRGIEYVRRQANLDADAHLIAVIEGKHDSVFGCAINN